MSSPSATTQPRSPARLLVLSAVLIGSLLYALFGRASPESPMAREYRLYKTESRPAANLQFEALSQVRDEAGLRSLLSGLKLNCAADWTGLEGATRNCSVDLKSFNGVPTMYANFTFGKEGLIRVSTAIPREAHEQGRAYMESSFGKPDAKQSRPRSGVRLSGWVLGDGSTLYYNRERFGETDQPSSIQWIPRNGCDGRPCIND
ncbi:MAG: hypothetical protein HY020_06470 [Burkholderiales bacterium]|nr:hypothetical protein [Burkholderiales bacterium]